MRVSRRQLLSVGLSVPALTLAGCQLPGSGPPPREFRVTQKSTFPEELPDVDWSLMVERPNALRSIDTPRIARTRGVEIEHYAGARWIDRPPVMIEPLIIQSFRSSQAIDVVVDRRANIRPDFLLQTDLTAFEAIETASGPPDVRVAMSATLITMPRREVVGTTQIARTVQAGATDLESIAMAFDDALGKVLKRLVEWTLRTGETA
ncbi:MAG TPA: ABC-type transport auxiliary lipoprotein family protein [Geminicoccaceae bacterium]